MPVTRRRFLAQSAAAAAGSALVPAATPERRPQDYIVVEGHRDIWELNDRFKLRDKAQHSPLRDFIVPRLIEGGVSVVIMPAGGDSVDERGGVTNLLEGSLLVLDMLLVEIEKTNGKATLIKTRADVPARPTQDRVQLFLDLEGGGSIQIDPEPDLLWVRAGRDQAEPPTQRHRKPEHVRALGNVHPDAGGPRLQGSGDWYDRRRKFPARHAGRATG
jgi:hypothetical protein